MKRRAPLAKRPTSTPRIAVFWATVLAIPMSSALVITILSRTLPHGGLAKVSLVFSLSLIGTVLPIGAQAKAAADAAANGAAGHVRWRPIAILTAIGAVASVPIAVVLRVPPLAVLCPLLSLVPALAVGVSRGELIGQGNLTEVAISNSIEVLLRLIGGVALGLVLKADGVALSTLVYTLGAWICLPQRHPTLDRIKMQGALVASTLLVVSIQADLLVAPRLLGSGADRYATASLPSKGVYLALSAAGWLVVAGALSQRRFLAAVRPVVLVVMAGVGLSIPTALAAPIIGKVLGRAAPSTTLVFVLSLAMALSAGNWILLQLRLARHAATLWVPPAVAIAILLVVGAMHPTSAGLATGLVLGQAIALVIGCLGLAYDIRTTEPPTDLPTLLLTSFGELSAETLVEQQLAHVTPAQSAPPEPLPPPPPALPPPPAAAAPRASATKVVEDHADEPDEAGSRSRTSSVLLAVATALITFEVFLQYPGLIVHDTRLDINLDPVTFIQRTWNLWEPFADMGRIQNQAVGYLFPMGPYFVIGHFLHVPTWIIERSWVALILAVALWGAARLADELDIGTPLTRV
ncbi:MAG TPA: alpha-(1-_3)-arabinofuranosyltransferase family protein, partial [Acidimicrobiales bacterium]|nr:alpha-(1->3)-arabinofuranosyltransferase family protein [Acidimicrobiales bacterium]